MQGIKTWGRDEPPAYQTARRRHGYWATGPGSLTLWVRVRDLVLSYARPADTAAALSRLKRRPGQRRRGRVSSERGDCHAGRRNSVRYSSLFAFKVPLLRPLEMRRELVFLVPMRGVDLFLRKGLGIKIRSL